VRLDEARFGGGVEIAGGGEIEAGLKSRNG
jgi:hypothetical protein